MTMLKRLLFILFMFLLPYVAFALTAQDCNNLHNWADTLTGSGMVNNPNSDVGISVGFNDKDRAGVKMWEMNDPQAAADYLTGLYTEAGNRGVDLKGTSAEVGIQDDPSTLKDSAGTTLSHDSLMFIMQQMMGTGIFNPMLLNPTAPTTTANSTVATSDGTNAHWWSLQMKPNSQMCTLPNSPLVGRTYTTSGGVVCYTMRVLPVTMSGCSPTTGWELHDFCLYPTACPAGYENWDASAANNNGAKYLDNSRSDFDPTYLNKAIKSLEDTGKLKGASVSASINTAAVQAMLDCQKQGVGVQAVSPSSTPSGKNYIIDDKGQVHYVSDAVAATFQSTKTAQTTTQKMVTMQDPNTGAAIQIPDQFAAALPQGAVVTSTSGTGTINYYDPATGTTGSTYSKSGKDYIDGVLGPNGGTTGTGGANGHGGTGDSGNYTAGGDPLSKDGKSLNTNGSGNPDQQQDDYTFSGPATTLPAADTSQFSTSDAQKTVDDMKSQTPAMADWMNSIVSLFPFANMIKGVTVNTGGSDDMGTISGSVAGMSFSQQLSLGPVAGGLQLLGEILYFFCALSALKMAMTKR